MCSTTLQETQIGNTKLRVCFIFLTLKYSHNGDEYRVYHGQHSHVERHRSAGRETWSLSSSSHFWMFFKHNLHQVQNGCQGRRNQYYFQRRTKVQHLQGVSSLGGRSPALRVVCRMMIPRPNRRAQTLAKYCTTATDILDRGFVVVVVVFLLIIVFCTLFNVGRYEEDVQKI